MPEIDQRFLVIRLSSIGDIVHTLPAVAELGRSFPRAEIHWLVEKRYAPLLAGNTFVRRVIEVDTLGWRKRPFMRRQTTSLREAWKAIREPRYGTTIDFQGLIKTGFLSFATGAPRRLAFGREWLREPAAGMFYTDRALAAGRRHIIELNLALVEHLGTKLGAWEFPLPSNPLDERAVSERIEASGIRDFILISPGGGWKSKCWPPESYADLIGRLEKEYQSDVLLSGSPSEEGLITTILDETAAKRARYFPSTLVQYIALARKARLFIGGDTGPLHLAAAVSTPVVAIFDANDPLNTPERNGPFNPADITVTDSTSTGKGRPRKGRDFLRGVPVGAVFDAVRERWERAYG
jgi:lipopolysaccharide heptosyltransferase I